MIGPPSGQPVFERGRPLPTVSRRTSAAVASCRPRLPHRPPCLGGAGHALGTVSALAVVLRRWKVAGRTVAVATLRERNRPAPRHLMRQFHEDSAAAVTPTSAPG